MSKPPAIPKSRRNLNDLDELIDQSLGQKEANYHQMFASSTATPAAPNTLVDTQTSLMQAPSPIRRPVPADDDPVERFQLDISRSVIVATKYEGVLKKTSASKIVELALRQYLNLPPRT